VKTGYVVVTWLPSIFGWAEDRSVRVKTPASIFWTCKKFKTDSLSYFYCKNMILLSFALVLCSIMNTLNPCSELQFPGFIATMERDKE
jgi:hypothetical protein